jgi:hypothetical protein
MRKIFLSELLLKWTKFKFRAKVSTSNLDGLDKWSLDPIFQVEIVYGGTNFEPQNVIECQEITWSCYKAQEG